MAKNKKTPGSIQRKIPGIPDVGKTILTARQLDFLELTQAQASITKNLHAYLAIPTDSGHARMTIFKTGNF